jgi:ribosome maturation factor RimP
MITESKLVKMIDAHLAGGAVFLVDIIVKPGNQISVFIDGDHRVNVETCRELSHFMNESLDRDAEDYDLTVSSAGIDRPLKLPRQYKKNIGNSLDVITKTGDKLSGVLLKSDETGIEMEIPPVKKSKKETEVKIVSLKFDDIKSAKEVITFKP